MKVRYLILFIILIINVKTNFLLSQDNISGSKIGSINGKITDRETKAVVEGASVRIIDSKTGTESNEKGEFQIDNLKYGNYRLSVSMVGYKPAVIADLVLSSSKPLEVEIELIPDAITTSSIDVEENYYQKSSDENTSVTNFDFEEIRRAPGANQDISRMMQSAPGVSIGNDQRNDLIVRGGSPNENLILIDGIEIPNINHFGSESTSGGAIGFINLKFIREANIYTGGFSSKYGDKLSGVVDIKFRDGSRKNYYNNLDLSFAGFGGIFEGPLTKKGSYMLSIRRSYLDFLKSAIRLTAVPNYWDFNLKLSYDLNKNNKLSLVGFSAIDKIAFNSNDAKSADDIPYNTDDKVNVYTAGINYRSLFKNGYIQTVLSNSFTKYYDNVNDSANIKHIFDSNSYENETNLKTEINYSVSKTFGLNAGLGWKHGNYKNNIYSQADTTPQDYIIPETKLNKLLNTNKFFSEANLTSHLIQNKFIVNIGARYDYFDYTTNKNTFSPRAAISYNLTNTTSINASWGIFYQTPSALWLNSGDNKSLKSIRCDHYILGIDRLLNPEIKVTAEAYVKKYYDYPVSVSDPTYILIDDGNNFGPGFIGNAVSAGYGYVRGFDFSFEKKLSGNGIYGLVTYSYSNSNFKALTGAEEPGSFDPKHQFTITAGYQVADDWLIGIKFKYMGGRPYTPFDIEKSIQLGRGVYDMNNFNGARYPDYSRLDVRVDKQFFFGKLCLTTYFELQNLYNRKNVYMYFWNKDRNTVGTIYHWAFMPVGGFNLQF